MESYASNWLLTAIKGPDYVDRPPLGEPSDEDWGYWTRFDYEKEQEDQIWRAPYSGTASSSDYSETYDIQNYSQGIREIVYLDEIHSPTHIAKFEASISEDRKTATFGSADPVAGLHGSISPNASGFFELAFPGNWEAEIDDLDNSGSPTKIVKITFPPSNNTAEFNTSELEDWYYDHEKRATIVELSFAGLSIDESEIYASVLAPSSQNLVKKLDNIKLYNKRDHHVNIVNGQWEIDQASATPIKTIDFQYSYELCHSTPSSDDPNQGKLTLKSLNFSGLGGATGLPGYSFEYAYGDLDGDYNPDYDLDHWDNWGQYRQPSTEDNHLTNQDSAVAATKAAWTLTKILTPTGGSIEIEYESDDYYHVGNTYDFSRMPIYDINNPGSAQGISFWQQSEF